MHLGVALKCHHAAALVYLTHLWNSTSLMEARTAPQCKPVHLCFAMHRHFHTQLPQPCAWKARSISGKAVQQSHSAHKMHRIRHGLASSQNTLKETFETLKTVSLTLQMSFSRCDMRNMPREFTLLNTSSISAITLNTAHIWQHPSLHCLRVKVSSQTLLGKGNAS